MCAQFSFVEKYDKKLYDWLIGAEKAARLRVDDCAKNVRCALEHIVATRINECVPNKSDLRRRYEEKWARKQKKWDRSSSGCASPEEHRRYRVAGAAAIHHAGSLGYGRRRKGTDGGL